MDQEYERRLLRQINHQNLPTEARLSKVGYRGWWETCLCLIVWCEQDPEYSCSPIFSKILITLLEFVWLLLSFLVIPVCKCYLQSCQCEVRGPLHSHPSWKQLEHQLPLCQREQFVHLPLSAMVFYTAPQTNWLMYFSFPLQENCRSPNQNHKAKDASSDSSKGQTCILPVNHPSCLFVCVFPVFPSPLSLLPPPPPPDAVAYAALLRNELLGAGIETVPDPHTDDRRHAVLSQDSHSLFRVRIMKEKVTNLLPDSLKRSLTLTS